MADYFFDSSALGKYYHVEVGTAEVDRLLKEPGARPFISRLNLVEVQSVFAGKVRKGAGLTQAELAKRAGVGRITVVRLENGRIYARTETLRRITGALGVRLVDLLVPEEEDL